jgi:hypothetical protein
MKTNQNQQPQSDLAYHPITARAQNEQHKADDCIPVILATEAGVPVYDKAHRKVVREYLLMSGAQLPKQVTMLDDHEDATQRSIGSIRSLEVNGDELHGLTYWSRRGNAQSIKQDVLDGHLTDMSVGAERLEETFVDTGKEAVIDGRKFKGPARVVTRWRPFHGAVVTRGADERSVFALRAYRNPESLCEEDMTASYRSHLESLGMPKEFSDEQALEWAAANVTRKVEAKPEPKVEITPIDAEVARKAAEDAIKTERQRVMDIRNTTRAAGLPDSFADGIIAEGKSKGEAAELALAELAKRSKTHGPAITPVGSEHESFRKAALDGLSLRIGRQFEGGEKPAPGAAEFRSLRFMDLAKKAVEFEGVSTRGLTDRDIIARAFSLGSNASLRASDGQAYLTSGNFSNLLLDAQNKTLLKSFMDTPSTYQQWVRQAESVPDFKNINRIRLGEIGNQPMVEENGDYKEMSLSDAKESYKVEKHGSIVSLTWEAMKNDDLSGFSRLVQLQGSAMRRTINRSVYDLLFSNPTLSDSVALFHSSSHGGNLDTLALSVANLNTGFSCMALQTGLDSNTILGITPRYLIVPFNLAATAEQILGSYADPGAGGSAAGNSNTLNIYGPQGPRRLTLIVEPLLDGNDTTAYYLAADHNVVDTIEMADLQGEETPVFEQDTAFIQDAVKFKIRQTWGVKAIDYRGLYKSTGGD